MLTGMREANCATGLAQLALKQTPIDKFLYLSTLRKNNVHLFYRLVTDHLRVCAESGDENKLHRESHVGKLYFRRSQI